MSIEKKEIDKLDIEAKALYDLAIKHGLIKKPKRPKKDNSVKGDIFLNCRCCGVLIRPDWYSQIDKRYCADCL